MASSHCVRTCFFDAAIKPQMNVMRRCAEWWPGGIVLQALKKRPGIVEEVGVDSQNAVLVKGARARLMSAAATIDDWADVGLAGRAVRGVIASSRRRMCVSPSVLADSTMWNRDVDGTGGAVRGAMRSQCMLVVVVVP